MKNTRYGFMGMALGLLIATSTFAACNPAQDACAPKVLKDAWSKSLAFGFNLTSGNSDTKLFTLLANASKETDADLINFGLTYNYGTDKNSVNDKGDDTTRNDIRGEAAYNYKLSPLLYAGLGTKFLYDEIAKVDYRVNLNPTLGYFVLKDDDFSLALETGPGYTFEKVDSETNNYFSPRIGDRFNWTISCTSKFYENAEVLFDTTNTSNYIVNSEVGLETALSSWLSLVVAAKDLLDHVPAPGKDKNDLQLITALKVSI